MNNIGIINCGMGNLTSVMNAFMTLRANCYIINSSDEIEDYEKIVLPGVGAFAKMMQNLNEMGFKEKIIAHISANRPFMGICLGMQVLFEKSFEFGETVGLSVLSGKVKKLPVGNLPVPNVGWWDLEGDYFAFSDALSVKDTFYFTHSFHCQSHDDCPRLTFEINEEKVIAAIKKNNTYGYQFHPEKSQNSGQKLLKSFVNL